MLLATLALLVIQTLVAEAAEQSCNIEPGSNYAPVCPGTAPRAANGCCWRNGVSETIDNWNGPDVVDEDADLDEGEELLELVCRLDKAGCQAADSGDWGEGYDSSSDTSVAIDTVRFFVKFQETVEEAGAVAEGVTEGPSGVKSKRIDFIKSKAQDLALGFACNYAKTECEEGSGGGKSWFWILVCFAALAAAVYFACKKKEEDKSSG